MVEITKATPELFFLFLRMVSSLEPCTIEKIRKGMKEVWGPVYSARNFAMEYRFVSFDEKNKTFSLAIDGERLLRFSENMRNEFLIHNFKLQYYEPFSSLQKEMSSRNKMSIREIGDFLNTKYSHKGKWTPKDIEEYENAVAEWLVFLRVAEKDKDAVKYVKGEVKTTEVLFIPEMGKLLDRTTYDFLTENFNTPHNILNEPYDLLEKTNKAIDDNEKGEFFELFIASTFRRLGFSPRLRDGERERKANLTFQRKGGGDIGVFCHFPIQAEKEILHGYAIACEGKASENVIGSKAIGQARNLCKKIQEFYPKYLVHTIVISQSMYGYDSSGREQAPPEVVHITSKVLLTLLDLQEKQLEKNLNLITPIHIMFLLTELVKIQELDPKSDNVKEIMLRLINENDAVKNIDI